MVGSVSRRENATKRAALTGDQIAILDPHIGHEIAVAAFFYNPFSIARPASPARVNAGGGDARSWLSSQRRAEGGE